MVLCVASVVLACHNIFMTPLCQLQIPGFAGGGFVALAGRGHAAAGCAQGVGHPAGQHTFSGAAHTPIGNRHGPL